MRSAAASLNLLITAGCASALPTTTFVPVSIPFERQDAAWSLESGSNTITGNALMRTVGGEARTCAGLRVNLVPDTRYTLERMRVTFGNAERGYLHEFQRNKSGIVDPNMLSISKQTVCDAAGNFEFRDIPDGTWYVLASVVWSVPQRYYHSTQGGLLMQRVEVEGGETKRIVVTTS